MAAPLRIQLTPEEDRLLLELSLAPRTHKKTRLWAMMIRLAAEGWTAPKIAQHFHKDRTTVYLVLRRFFTSHPSSLIPSRAFTTRARTKRRSESRFR